MTFFRPTQQFRLCRSISTVPFDRFAGRYTLGSNQPPILSKNGARFKRVDGTEVRVLGGACSEVLGGANLAAILKEGFEVEQRAIEAMLISEPAEVIPTIHLCGSYD